MGKPTNIFLQIDKPRENKLPTTLRQPKIEHLCVSLQTRVATLAQSRLVKCNAVNEMKKGMNNTDEFAFAKVLEHLLLEKIFFVT